MTAYVIIRIVQVVALVAILSWVNYSLWAITDEWSGEYLTGFATGFFLCMLIWLLTARYDRSHRH